MPKLYHRNEWFFELAPSSMQESEFEQILIRHASIIRPGTKIVPYKRTVYSGDDSARADLAIISNDYKDWFVVEVEMIRHSLHGHVVPQVRTLRGAAYGQADADYLAAKDNSLDAYKLSQMMKGRSPEILVITNKFDEEWSREIRRYSALMMTMEIYRSDMNHYIFSINGGIPSLGQTVLTFLEVDSLLSNFLVVASPAALELESGVRIPMLFDGQVTEWERVEISSNYYLASVGRMPLVRGAKYVMVRNENDQLSIRIATPKDRE